MKILLIAAAPGSADAAFAPEQREGLPPVRRARHLTSRAALHRRVNHAAAALPVATIRSQLDTAQPCRPARTTRSRSGRYQSRPRHRARQSRRRSREPR